MVRVPHLALEGVGENRDRLSTLLSASIFFFACDATCIDATCSSLLEMSDPFPRVLPEAVIDGDFRWMDSKECRRNE